MHVYVPEHDIETWSYTHVCVCVCVCMCALIQIWSGSMHMYVRVQRLRWYVTRNEILFLRVASHVGHAYAAIRMYVYVLQIPVNYLVVDRNGHGSSFAFTVVDGELHCTKLHLHTAV
jgi:hypothetical protein